jgi:transcriptional regulator with XRE-family HTH domain
MSLSKRIRDLRYAKGWGPDDLAAQAGLSRTALYNIERERTRHPHAATLRQIAEALEVPMEALYGKNAVELPLEGAAQLAHSANSPSLSAERRWEVEGKFLDLLNSPLADGIALLVEESYHLLQQKTNRTARAQTPPPPLVALPVDAMHT